MVTFFIAIKNTETDEFEFKTINGNSKPEEFISIESAIRDYESQIEEYGKNNVMICEKVYLNIDTKITRKIIER